MTELSPRDHQHFFGHQTLLKRLKQSYDQGRLHHGLIFTGLEGVGKETLAYQLIRYALAFPQGKTDQQDLTIPADHRVAKQVTAQSDPHIFLIQPVYDEKKQRFARDITLDALEDLSNFLRLAPTDDAPRFIIINPADSLNRNAQNALLKALEEPPAKTFFILITTQAGALLPTIRSRCMTMHFEGVDKKDFQKGVMTFAPEMEAEQVNSYYALTSGSIGQAIQYEELGVLELYADFCTQLVEYFEKDSVPAMKFAESIAYNTDEAAVDRLTDLWFSRLAAFIKSQISQQKIAPIIPEEERLLTYWGDAPPQSLLTRYDAALAMWKEGEASYLDKKIVLLNMMAVLCGADGKKSATIS